MRAKKTEFMEDFGAYFEPWVGRRYGLGGKKLLIVGDSHYCGECPRCGVRGMVQVAEMGECRQMTRKTVRQYLEARRGERPMDGWMGRTYLRFDKMMLGQDDVTPAMSEELWNGVAFYNFVQTAASMDPSNTNYSADDYKASGPIFKRVMEILLPDRVIVWGNRAYEAMPGEGWRGGADYYRGTYALGGGHEAWCLRMIHPSRAATEEWREKLRDFMR